MLQCLDMLDFRVQLPTCSFFHGFIDFFAGWRRREGGSHVTWLLYFVHDPKYIWIWFSISEFTWLLKIEREGCYKMSHILSITWGVMPGAIDLISKKHDKSEVPQFFSFFSRVCFGEALQETWEFSFRGTFAKEVAHFHEANIPKLHTWLIQGKWMKKKRKRRSAFFVFFFPWNPGDPGGGLNTCSDGVHLNFFRFLTLMLWTSLELMRLGWDGERWGGEYQLGQNLWRINTLWKCWGIFSKWCIQMYFFWMKMARG